MNYYNDNDSFSVKWLKALIAEGLIPEGDVDDRSITEIKPSELDGYVQCHFFAGIGGWPYALRLSGWPEDRPVWTGSCPCQPFSVAGKGKGIKDERHLWPAFRWLIAQKRPATIFGEQIAESDGREWLSGVRLDLETMGYEVGAADLCAAGVGAPHIRQRLFWVAKSKSLRLQKPRQKQGCASKAPGRIDNNGLADSKQQGLEGHAGDGDRRNQPGRQQAHADGSTAKGGAAGFWSNSIPIPCADGKWRRVPGRVVNTEVTHGGDGGRPGESKGKNDTAEKSREGHGGLSESGIGRETGSTKINIEIKSSFLLLSDGFWYRMADVHAELITQAIKEISDHARKTKTSSKETLSMVQKGIETETLQWKVGRSDSFLEKKMLLSFLFDIASTLNRTTDSGSSKKKSAQNDERMLRDLRNHITSKCSSYRRKPNEQQETKPTAPLQSLSQFLAQCSETCRDYQCRTYAATFPLAGDVVGRVGALRGAGNAIVPQVAVPIIEAIKSL
jgi:DNA (cytosine-5)-methyltransferase 1